MLTNEKIKELQSEQEKLDGLIIQKNNITDSQTTASFIRTKIALLVEIGELANELKTFKHWKKQKDINWDKAKEELIDCLHFYLSWVNAFQIDFSDYKFQKLAPEPDFNELLLALFSETEAFSIGVPWNIVKQNAIANFEKNWQKNLNHLGESAKKEEFEKEMEKIKKNIEKTNISLSEGIKEDKNKASFYRWLIIFEELAQKMGMKDENDIYDAYMKKNQKNRERQEKNY